MKTLKPDLTLNQKALYWLCSCLIIGALFIFTLLGCSNDIDRINSLTSENELPSRSGKNIEVHYTDSCRLKLIFKTPQLEMYLHKEKEPYYEFRKGIEVLFFDVHENLESRITSKYAKHYATQKLWIARDSVFVRNIVSGEELTTEELFWDQDEKRIYSNVFTKIITTDGVYFGEKGFESDQDFKNYKLIGSSGSVRVKNEE